MSLPNPGTYAARRNAPMVIEQSEGGALLCWVPYVLITPDFSWTGKHLVTLGRKDKTLDFSRQALHAARLTLCHPETGEVMEFTADLPEDMRALLEMLEG